MNVTFLLEDTGISGTTRAVLAHADALVDLGHVVRIVTSGPDIAWRSSRAEWVYVDELRQYTPAEEERVVSLGALPAIVDEEVYRSHTTREHEPLRVLLSGASHLESHAIEDGYGAVAHARWFHRTLHLIRVSPWAPSREEPLDAVQEFHVGLTTAEMTRLLHSCDMAIVPSRRDDRFPLPAAEALAAGLACVFTAVPSLLSFDPARDYALFGPEDNAVELGERLIELLGDFELRERLRERGRVAAEQWRPARAVERLLERESRITR
jgi:glycosyltransferase involved in cell wall biosynthesis